MSVYSGFATRQLETQYNQLVNLLIFTLSKRLVKVYKQENCSEKAFRGVFYRIVSSLKILESNKYIPPKFTDNVKPLYELLQLLDSNDNDKQSNFLVESNGFDAINLQTSKILAYDMNSRYEKFSDMPPHPLKNLRVTVPVEANQIDSFCGIKQSKTMHFKPSETPFNENQQTESTSNQENVQIKSFTIPKDGKQVVDTKFQNTCTFADLSLENSLPLINEQKQLLNPEFINRISDHVEQQLIEKLSKKKKFKMNKPRKQKKNFNQTFRSKLLEADHNESVLRQPRNYDPNQTYGQGFKFIPLSEGNRTRPKFYSMGK